jgi:hypothetical protein
VREPPVCTAVGDTVAAVLALQIRGDLRAIINEVGWGIDMRGARLTGVTAATEGKVHGTCPLGSGRPARKRLF